MEPDRKIVDSVLGDEYAFSLLSDLSGANFLVPTNGVFF